MKEYIITYVCGDTYNIPTYDVVSCEEKDLVSLLDENSDYGFWRRREWVQIYEVSKKLDKSELS